MRPEVEVVQGRLWKVLDDNPNLATDSAGRKIPESTNPQMIGIPIGLAEAIPIMLQNRGDSYKNRSVLEVGPVMRLISMGPSSAVNIKLLWAPIVDSLYWSRFSRRKSCLRVNRWLENSEGNDVASHVAPNIPILTVIFIVMDFLAATQDIAVGADDAEALQYRSRVHLQQRLANARYFLGYVAFMALESAEFCISYLRSEPVDECLVTLPGFLWFWGLVFLVTTTLIALLVVHLNPLQIILPLQVHNRPKTHGSQPQNMDARGWPYQIAPTLFAAAVVWFTPAMIYDHHVPYHYYQILLTNYGLYQIALYSMFVAVMAFLARISDPAVGETYMTLLNTLNNLGRNWPITVVLWMVDVLTSRWRRKTQNTSKFLRLTNRTELAVSMIRRQMGWTDREEQIKATPSPINRSGTSEAVDELLEDLLTKPIQLKNITTRHSIEYRTAIFAAYHVPDVRFIRGYHLIVVLFADVAVAGLITGTSSLASKQAKLLEDPRMVQQNVNVTFSEILSNEIVHYQIAGEEKSQTKT
ncbi:acetyl-coenzyme A transporter 1 [Culex quinquefasciatus]|uniref:Acetyl-coenzyme A transporter 1 n=1 Tax=Culex quinquefasciatus TaxID=7176 RepID=B0WK99_CULQU|nr:acetyl-coenzyme A transporter 1 [Culex quinquefasciatus]|eukprot:XP_001849133.1 acetyl-coenzyme A transporter 1 [Culex quinquefasciatus]